MTPLANSAFLRPSRHDLRLLEAALGTACEPSIDKAIAERTRWRGALGNLWKEYQRPGQESDIYLDVARVAIQLSDWALAQRVLYAGLSNDDGSPEALSMLGLCCADSGRIGDASAALELAANNESAYAAQLQWLNDRCRHWKNMPWYRGDIARDEELALEPLDGFHAQALWEQYRDDDIGVMTRLPELPNVEATRTWITEQTEEAGRAIYAVMHGFWGFIGAVSVRRHEDAGYFYFWIGTDFQRRGFGRRSARLLFSQARAMGLREIFTSVYLHNARSRRALAALGFDALPTRGRFPDDDLLFLRHALSNERPINDGCTIERLRELLARIDSPIQLEDLIITERNWI